MNKFKKYSLIIIILITLAGLYWGYWSVFNYRFAVVTKDKVYRSGEMPLKVLQLTAIHYKLKSVIDFRKTSPQVQAEKLALTAIGVNHIHLPSSQVPAVEVVKTFLKIMDQPETYPVLFHCEHGYGRTMLFTAIFRMEYENWSNQDAKRACRLLTTRFSGFDDNASKGKFLNNYIPLKRNK